MSKAREFLEQAVELARENVRNGGRPFGAFVVKDSVVIAAGVNETTTTNDPTAHAELVAVRVASQELQSPRLDGCTVYASGHPCAMCFAAMLLAGVDEVFYAHSNEDGEAYGLSSTGLYAELAKVPDERSLKMIHVRVRNNGDGGLYELWKQVSNPRVTSIQPTSTRSSG